MLKTNITLLNISILSATMLVSACGGSSNQTNAETETNPQEPSKPLGKNALAKAGSTKAFLDYYQLGLKNNYDNLTEKAGSVTTDAVAENAAPTSDGDSGGSNVSGFGVSSTNLIEQGVDEVDVVKQNATHIFTTSREQSTTTSSNQSGYNTVDVIHAYAKPSTAEIGSYQLEGIYGLNGIFLKENKLIALANKSRTQWYIDNQAAYKTGELEIKVLDVTDPSNMELEKTYAWEGALRTSRRIGDSLYVISSASIRDPWGCAAVEPAIITSDSPVASTSLPPVCEKPAPLTEAEVVKRMPVDINGNKIKPEDCLIPADYKDDDKRINGNITLVTKVDLTENAQHETTCISASAQHVYMNTKSIYLVGYGNNNDTAINKLSINQGTMASPSEKSINYVGSGRVAGYIDWNTAGSFSLNEHNDVLRVVTTQSEIDKVTNRLHTLKVSDDKVELENIVTLPNKENPAPIGKPNERLRGVRFLGNEAYVVTFEQTDPLYKIDLTDPSKPVIKGELEMLGYSAYLHRISDTYLLGVGYSANESGRITGVQTTVFDTSSDAPTIVSQKTVKNDTGWVRLPISWDSRAITTITQTSPNNEGTMRIALPFSLHGYINGEYTAQKQAAEYTVNLATGKLTEAAKRQFVESNEYANAKRRAMLDGNDIYYNLDNGAINKYVWAKPSTQ